MISRKELAEYAEKLGFNIYQAEKDYLQHAFLASLYSVSSTEFIFKGGTAMQKAYGLDRFSEDLDFTLNSTADAMQFLEKAVVGANSFAKTTISRKDEKTNSFIMKLKMEGPLYAGAEKTLQTIVIETSLREKVLRKTDAVRIVPIYADLTPYTALVMSPEEMFAEKVRAIMTRDKPRDLYDLWFLLKKKTRFDPGLADGKLAYYSKKFTPAEFKKEVNNKEKNWAAELKILMKNVPDFKETKKAVLDAVK